MEQHLSTGMQVAENLSQGGSLCKPVRFVSLYMSL